MSSKRNREESPVGEGEGNRAKRLKRGDLLDRITSLLLQKVSKQISLERNATHNLACFSSLSEEKQLYLQTLGIQMSWCHPGDVLRDMKLNDPSSLTWFQSLNVMRAAYSYENDRIRYNDCLDDLVDRLCELYS